MRARVMQVLAAAVVAAMTAAASAQVTGTFNGGAAGSGGARRNPGGRVVDGTLQRGDTTLPGGEFMDVVPFEGRRGQRVVLRLVSDEFDAYLLVQSPSGGRFEDDDGGKAPNARLVMHLGEDGTYQLGVTSARPGETGRYSLEIRSDGGRLAPITGAGPRLVPAPGALAAGSLPAQAAAGVRPVGQGGPILRPAPGVVSVGPEGLENPPDLPPDVGPEPGPSPAPEIPEGEPLTAGRTVNGTLAGGDDSLGDGQLVDWYSFEGSAGQRVMLDLSARQFDAYLVVRSPGGTIEQNDDIAPGTTDSRLAFTLPEDGLYLVGASSYRQGEQGAYALRFVPAGGEGPSETGVPAVTPGRQVEGRLAEGDDTLSAGEWVDWYTFSGEPGQVATLDLSSSEFDTYLVVVTPSGAQLDNDDVESGNTNSRISRRIDQAGEYQVGVTSYQQGETGRYELSFSFGSDAPAPAPDERPATNVSQGTSTSGTLANGDTTLDSGEFVDSYDFEGTQGQAVRIDMQSSDFDPYLILRFPSGRQVDNDDAAPNVRNSLVELVLPESGTFHVQATSYGPGETGRYDLGISVGDVTPEQPGPVTGQVPNQSRQFYGVFVGISDYPGGISDLPYCREDAEKLGRSFNQIGLMDSGHVDVITDSQATEANVRAALRRAASRVGPDDVFVFFYSGHGSQSDPDPRAHPEEIDSREESIILGNDQYTDNEMAADLDSIHAGLTVVALDSCFAGGFARDVVSKPDRVGFFSSEEDLTSNVASEFQAGGYLSLFFRQAIEGRADTNRDGLIQIGEMSHYIQDQYAQNVREATSESAEGAGGYQHLVVDRGGVRVDTLFFRLGDAGGGRAGGQRLGGFDR